MQRPSGSRGSPLHGSQLVLVLMGIVLATAVLPPVAAWRLNRHRIAQTWDRVQRAAESVRMDTQRLESLGPELDVAVGPGHLPRTIGGDAQAAWLSRAMVAPAAFGTGMPTDAWGQCFLMNVGDLRRGGRVWILSAGPNGRIDTPRGAAELAGDDIGTVIR